MFRQALTASLLLATQALAGPIERATTSGHNDFSCRSTTHPNPVVLMHGLGATYYEDINLLDSYLKSKDFCTFSITYGEYPEFPFFGGLRPIKESAATLAAFIKEVQTKTGAKKVDIVGHSEGGFMSLYVPKMEPGVKEIVQRIVSIAPPTHGTDFLAEIYKLTYLLAPNLTQPLVKTILDTFGCPACENFLPTGEGVKDLNNGPIAQKGISYTIIASKYDELVTPTDTAFVHEAGVRNLYIQDFCPADPVGHIGEAYDTNVWAIVENSFSDSTAGPTVCSVGSPGK